jgi:SAM-dependent methyltransferase
VVRRAECFGISSARSGRSRSGARFQARDISLEPAVHAGRDPSLPQHVNPSLPIPDNHFDLITGFSAFTHIDDLESPWLLELRRILKPGGLLYLTIHDEACWDDMPEALLAAIRKSPNGAGVEMGSPFPGERAAFHFTELSYYSCNVFHSRDYVERQWGRFFDLLDIRPKGHNKQCVVLMTYR